MFSGIVEAIGAIVGLTIQGDCKCFVISSDKVFEDIVIGESIAVNGVCLTVSEFTETTFSVTAVPETLRLTNLDSLVIGSNVNLERSIKFGARVGGHYVQGHVEGVGEIVQITNEGDAMMVKINVSPHLEKYLVNKGYVAIDGMSITIIEAAPGWFNVTFVPHTQGVTIASKYKKGTRVNLETDMMAKHIEKLLRGNSYALAN